MFCFVVYVGHLAAAAVKMSLAWFIVGEDGRKPHFAVHAALAGTNTAAQPALHVSGVPSSQLSVGPSQHSLVTAALTALKSAAVAHSTTAPAPQMDSQTALVTPASSNDVVADSSWQTVEGKEGLDCTGRA